MHDSAMGRRAALAAMSTLGASAVALAGFAQPESRGMPRQPRDERGAGEGEEQQPRPLTPEQLGWDPEANQYTLPALPYAHDALEPFIDAQTMQLHHEHHHRAYVGNLNRALRALWEIREGEGDENLTAHWMRQVSFNGSGHFNHAIFWQIMAPPREGEASDDGDERGARAGGGQPGGELARAISRDFGSFGKFGEQFRKTAGSVMGGGWAWLALDTLSSRLMIVQMESQHEATFNGMIPLMGVDVWEHAYYLKYQNRRAEYVEAFMNVINWPRVEDLFALAARRTHWRAPTGRGR